MGLNENMRTGPEGFRLITYFEGKPRLTARLCEGGRWELGYGCTFWPPTPDHPHGRPVEEGESCTPDQIEPLLLHALGIFEDVIKRRVKVALNQNQFDALVALVFNIGEANFSTSSVLRYFNESRFEDAAKAFGLWTKATSSVDANGNHWLSPDGLPCEYTRALRGLLRRHYAEACVSLGFDFVEACADDAIALRAEKVWETDRNRWHDRVLWDQTTPWTQVLAVARNHPLPLLMKPSDRVTAVMPLQPPEPVRAPPAPAPAPAKADPVGGVISSVKVVEKKDPAPPAPVGTKPKSPNTVLPADVPYKIDANAGLKPLEESERAKGYWYQQAGIGMIRLGSLGVFGTAVQGGAQTLQGDPVLSNLVLTAFVVGGIAITGFVVKSYGEWRRKRGEKAATQGLF